MEFNETLNIDPNVQNVGIIEPEPLAPVPEPIEKSKKKRLPPVLPLALPVLAPVKKERKPLDRDGYAVFFYGEEKRHLLNIFEARKQAGITIDKAHFVRQAIDFAINFDTEFKQYLGNGFKNKSVFAVPAQPKIILKNGFYGK